MFVPGATRFVIDIAVEVDGQKADAVLQGDELSRKGEKLFLIRREPVAHVSQVASGEGFEN